MSTDRELLELAAKAAGYRLKNEIVNFSDELLGFRIKDRPLPGAWNPLTDDGDALRLAVKLDLDIEQISVEVAVGYFLGNEDWQQYVYETWGEDKEAATRRAIVRAAAEIGRSLP